MIFWGVIGYGKIAHRFVKSLSYSNEGKLYAVATQTPSLQKECHQQHDNVKVYQNYDDLLDDKQVDAVYIALRHADHYAWAKKALLKNKVVLCEKPATLSYEQTKELCHLSQKKQVFFMEAMKTRFVPMYNEIKDLVEKGTIGTIQRIETSFCSEVTYDDCSYLFDNEQGGALYDVGIYNIACILDFIQAPIQNIHLKYEKSYEVDSYDQIEIVFETGQSAYIELGIDRNKDKCMKIIGSLGTITTSPFYRPIEAIIDFENGTVRTESKNYVNDDFYGEIEEVHRCIKCACYESSRMSHRDSLECMKIIERIKELMK